MELHFRFTISLNGNRVSDWVDVPSLAVLTGPNGSGKSVLLRAILRGMVGWSDRHSLPNVQDPIEAEMIEEGRVIRLRDDDVFYSQGEWPTLSSKGVNAFQVAVAIQSLTERRRWVSVGSSLAQALGTEAQELSLMTPTAFAAALTPSALWAHTPEREHDVSFLFMAYRVLERLRRNAGASQEIVEQELGTAPWKVLGEIIHSAGLPFEVNAPEPIKDLDSDTEIRFQLALTDERGVGVPIEGLSSGEKILLSTALWIYGAKATGRHFKVLLLDEPDAHLHPSLTRHFINLLQEAFVDRRGVKVIMTTHSPATASIVPKESLFELFREEPGVVLHSRRDQAVSRLTGGFVAVQDATRTVLVEGRADPEFYRATWTLLTSPSHTHRSPMLPSYPPLSFVYGQGRHTVAELVPQIRAAGYENFFGIVDRDRGWSGAVGVLAPDRYSVESYLYDPLVIWCALLVRGTLPEGRRPSAVSISDVRYLPNSELQDIVDSVVAAVESVYPPEEAECDRVLTQYCTGASLMLPGWCLTWKKAILRGRMARVFHQFSEDELLDVYLRLGVVSTDLKVLYETIQHRSSASL